MQRLSSLWLSIAVQDDGSCLICHCSLIKALIADYYWRSGYNSWFEECIEQNSSLKRLYESFFWFKNTEILLFLQHVPFYCSLLSNRSNTNWEGTKVTLYNYVQMIICSWWLFMINMLQCSIWIVCLFTSTRKWNFFVII